jgi:hypothetical protein
MSQLIVYKHRTNLVQVDLGMDTSSDVITSQIRSEIAPDSPLLGTWTVTAVDAANGEYLFTMDDTITAQIVPASGYMDIKRVSGGEPLPVLDQPIEVVFRGAVTA